MKFTRMQLGYFYILMAMNPIFMLGFISFIGKSNGEMFGSLENFLAGIYVIVWIVIVISYLIKKDKWIKKHIPKTNDQIIAECWDQHREEKKWEERRRDAK